MRQNSSMEKGGGDKGAFLGRNPEKNRFNSSGSLPGAKKLLFFGGISGKKKLK
jgi:hypothetical protein